MIANFLCGFNVLQPLFKFQTPLEIAPTELELERLKANKGFGQKSEIY